MELQIDAKELLKQVLNDVEPGEDVDEAIFRACKRRYSRNSDAPGSTEIPVTSRRT